MKKITFLSSFWIKLLAILFMTFDHLGIYLALQYNTVPSLIDLSNIFRVLGRFSLPLFAFMIAEGVMHTKSIRKYILRLGIIASLISIVFIIFEYTNLFVGVSALYRHGNIFIDLILTALAIYFVKHKDIRIKLLTLLPLAFSILSFVVKGIETSQKIDIHWFPYFLTLQYDWITVVLGLAFYFAYYLGKVYIGYLEEKSGIDKSIWIENGSYRFVVNLVSVLLSTIILSIQYAITFLWSSGVFWDASIQLYSLFSGVFLLCYSGKRGYNSKWFQYGAYLYYPLHILVIAIIVIIQNGGL